MKHITINLDGVDDKPRTLSHHLGLLRDICDSQNASEGNLTELDCELCKNKGYILTVDNDYVTIETQECECMPHRRNKRHLEKEGLIHLFETYTFDLFEAKEEWQKKFKELAYAYSQDPQGWLFIGGQIGSGKTLVGISVLNEFMNRGEDVRFVRWQDFMNKLKAVINDQEYFDILDHYTNVDVLYIDDLFKGGYENKPTDSDVRLTQIIIDTRYVQNKTTIISTELLVNDIMKISESIGSRIVEKSKGNIIQIEKLSGRNYRLR